MKNEELLVKRALSGDRNLESIKKINLGVLRKELEKLSDAEWKDFCHDNIEYDYLGAYMHFGSLGFYLSEVQNNRSNIEDDIIYNFICTDSSYLGEIEIEDDETGLKDEEILVKRALSGRKSLGGIKKIDLGTLKNKLRKIRRSKWLELCRMNVSSDKFHICMNFCGFSFRIFKDEADAADKFADFLEDKELWESEDDRKKYLYAGYESPIVNKYILAKYWGKYAAGYIEDGKKRSGFFDWWYSERKIEIETNLLDSIRLSDRAKEFGIDTVEED